MTFQQLLTEKMVRSFQSSHGHYVEVFKDPTSAEVSSLIPKWTRRERMGFSDHTNDQLGGYITSKHIWVWDRMKADHFDVKDSLSKLGIRQPYYPIYVEIFMNPVKTRFRIARYTMSRRAQMMLPSDAQWAEFLRKNPAIKSFPTPHIYGWESASERVVPPDLIGLT